MSRGDPTDTGVPVYPRLPVPRPRESDPSIRRKGIDRKLVMAVVGTLVSGIVLGFVMRPVLTTDPKVHELDQKLTQTEAATETIKKRADDLEKSLDKANKSKHEAEIKLGAVTKVKRELASRVEEAEAKAKAAKAVQDKLQASVDKGIGIVSADGDEIRLRLVSKVLFKTYDDHLTPRGKRVLDRVAVALKDKEISDKQIWVQGHTDDVPIIQPPKTKKPTRGRRVRGKKKEEPPPPRFATNWELSAARALTVVHYLQDVAKVDPHRLAALAFGQYRPVSRRNRAANRRIEIVLYPKPIVKRKLRR